MSSYVDATGSSVQHCEAMAIMFPDLAEPYYNKFAAYCQQKLWHQLTLLTLEFIDDKSRTLRALDSVEDRNTLWALYHHVILKVKSKLNGLGVAQIAAEVAFLSVGDGGSSDSAGKDTEVDKSRELLETLLGSVQQPAILFIKSKLSLLSMVHPKSPAAQTLSPESETMSATNEAIKENAALLRQMTLPETPEAAMVHAAHYQTSMTYFKIIGPPEAYYEEAVQYLNYYNTATSASGPAGEPKGQDEAKRLHEHQLAVDLCLAALTGDGVYNLGQIAHNPILKSLENTPEAWLVDMLRCCATGSVVEFKDLVINKYAANIAQQPALVNRAQALQEKATLLALVQMVFERPSSERTLKLEDIASRLQVPLEQVEWILMRAFSVKLLAGSMDQVDGTVHITWVLPRTLDATQMEALSERFGAWAETVKETKAYMQEQSPALTA